MIPVASADTLPVELLESLERLEQMPRPKTPEPETPRIDSNITVPCEKDLRELVDRLAESEERFTGQMARVLLKEALRARGVLPEPEPSAA